MCVFSECGDECLFPYIGRLGRFVGGSACVGGVRVRRLRSSDSRRPSPRLLCDSPQRARQHLLRARQTEATCCRTSEAIHEYAAQCMTSNLFLHSIRGHLALSILYQSLSFSVLLSSSTVHALLAHYSPHTFSGNFAYKKLQISVS